MTVTQTRTVAETDVALRVARDFLLDAMSWPWEDEPLSRSQDCWRRVDALLEHRLELQRTVLDRQVEAWWRATFPGTPWPVWPAGQSTAGEER